MIWILALIALPLVLGGIGALVIRQRVAKVQREELSRVEFALEELEDLFRTRRDCLPELISICRVFTDYERKTLVRLQSLHNTLINCPDIAERIVAENEVSEFLRDLVNTIGSHDELEKNVFLQQLLQKVHQAEARIADRRARVNQRVDEYNDALTTGILAKFGSRFGLTPLRRLDMTAQELLRATRVFGSDGADLDADIDADIADVSDRDEPHAAAPADPFDSGDEFDLSDDVDEFGGEVEDMPTLTPTVHAEPDPAADIRMIEVDDDDGF